MNSNNFLEFILIFCCLVALIRATKQNKKRKEKKNNSYKYYKKDSVMSENERDFYYILREEIEKKECRVFSQVALYEIVKARDFGSFQKIAKKTIDFVIIDKKGNTIKCIELNDKSHKLEKRKKRDNFVKKVLEECKIELIEIKAKMNYSRSDIIEIIKDI